MGELLRIFVGSRMAGQPFMVTAAVEELKTEEVIKDGVADIGGMPDVMDKIMDWGDS